MPEPQGLVDGATSDTLSLTTAIDISVRPLPIARSAASRRSRRLPTNRFLAERRQRGPRSRNLERSRAADHGLDNPVLVAPQAGVCEGFLPSRVRWGNMGAT